MFELGRSSPAMFLTRTTLIAALCFVFGGGIVPCDLSLVGILLGDDVVQA